MEDKRLYYVDIPGNYLMSWQNDFSAQVDKNRYKRIDYKIWREIANLAKVNKLRIVITAENGDYTSFTFFYPTNSKKQYLSLSVKENEFARYLNNWLYGLENKNGIELNWSKIQNDDNNIIVTPDNVYIKTDSNSWENIPVASGSVVVTPDSTYVKSDSNDWKNLITTSTSYYDADSLRAEVDRISEELAKIGTCIYDSEGNIIFNEINKNKDEKENKNEMNTNEMINFDFGPVTDSKIRMSMYGYAIPNEAGKYVAYDVENERMMDVQILNFNCANMFYKIPKPISKITYGDVVFHNGVPMFVTDIYEDRSRLIVIDPKTGTEKTILPAHSIFNFDYITCLVSLMDGFDTPADVDHPFGNLLPFVLMNNGQTADQTLPLLLMMNGKMDIDNPLMLFALCGNTNINTNNPLMLMAMMKMFDK